MSVCSAVSTWSSCTGVAVWLTGKTWPSATSLLDVPGVTSTKKLPSRKMRGRILNCASECSGRPLSWICIVTSAPLSPWCARSIFVTLPTSTPAIRTGDALRRLFALLNAALTV